MIRRNDLFSSGFGKVWGAEKGSGPEVVDQVPNQSSLKASPSSLTSSTVGHLNETSKKTGQEAPELNATRELRLHANSSSDVLRSKIEQKGLDGRLKALETKYYNQGTIDRNALRKALFPDTDETVSDSNNAGLALAVPVVPFESRHTEETRIDPKLHIPIRVGNDTKIMDIDRKDIQGKDFVGNLIKEIDKAFENWFGSPDKEELKKEDTVSSEPVAPGPIPDSTPLGEQRDAGGNPLTPTATASTPSKTADESLQSVKEAPQDTPDTL